VVNRYVTLEDGENLTNERLKAYNDRIVTVKFQLRSLTEKLEEEEAGAQALIALKEQNETEKATLWDSMTKDQVRELGRRDDGRKRQKLG